MNHHKSITLNPFEQNNFFYSLVLKFILFSFLTLVSTQVRAAAESQYWTSVQFSAPLPSDFGFVAEYINRYSGDSEEWVTRSNRIGFSYKLTDNWGYSLQVENRDTDNNANNEIRYINQLSRSWKNENYKLGLRLRYELREFTDSLKIQNRARVMGRVDANVLEFYGITPIATLESFYILNQVGNQRPDGGTEVRAQVGGGFDVWGQEMELYYLARQVYRPRNDFVSSRTTDYNIVHLVYKLSFE